MNRVGVDAPFTLGLSYPSHFDTQDQPPQITAYRNLDLAA